MIFTYKNKYGVCVLCKYLKCSKSGYYDWIKRGKPTHNKVDLHKVKAIETVYYQKKSRGRRQVQMQLERQFQIHMSLGSVHRYMKILKIQSIRSRKYKGNKARINKLTYSFPNVLEQDFFPSSTADKWLTDITHISAKDGTFYLSCIKDMRDKSIIAYHYSIKNDIDLVMKTLQKVLKNSKKAENTILHSDQGSQYSSKNYHEFLSKNNIIGSMSRKGNPYDNSPMESFFSILKNEELNLYTKLTKVQKMIIIDDFIRYYNYERPQYNLKKLTPIEFRSQLLK